MKLPFENIKLKFGMHKGKQLKDIPDDYLKFLLSKDILTGKALFHCQVRFRLPTKTFLVSVSDSAMLDGGYVVQAYNKKHAMTVCRRQYNVQNTQSFHGTEYTITQLNP